MMEGKQMYKSACAALLIAGLTATMSVIPTAPAAAKPLERQHFHDTTSEVVHGFCGDLTIRVDADIRGSVLVNARGRDRLAYYSEQVHGSFSYTNLANDKSLIQVFNINDKDLKVTDNGDGTLTDPADDEMIEFLGVVKESTGRNDTQGRDFCADIHEFIG